MRAAWTQDEKNSKRRGDDTRGVLLLNGSYYGTLNAARAFKLLGFNTTLADFSQWNISGFSRGVDRYLTAPSAQDLDGLYDWLRTQGPSLGSPLLYPTSDDLCWLIAENLETLQQCYKIPYPGLDTIIAILDKSQLYARARDVGMKIIETRCPRDQGEFEQILQQQVEPFLLKPRTQMGMRSKVKGLIVEHPEQALQKWKLFQEQIVYHPRVSRRCPDIHLPLMQDYLEEARRQTYSLAGFIDRSGQYVFARASRKMYQYPPSIGVGICFESQPVQETLLAKLAQLLRNVGYFGIFEAEFVVKTEQSGEQEYLLMDVNPRFYGQMGFELARQLPVHELLQLQVAEDEAAIAKLHAQDQNWNHLQARRYMNRRFLRLVLLTQRLGGQLSRSEYRWWKSWLADASIESHDFLGSSLDPRPEWVFWVETLLGMLKHPRSALKNLFL